MHRVFKRFLKVDLRFTNSKNRKEEYRIHTFSIASTIVGIKKIKFERFLKADLRFTGSKIKKKNIVFTQFR